MSVENSGIRLTATVLWIVAAIAAAKSSHAQLAEPPTEFLNFSIPGEPVGRPFVLMANQQKTVVSRVWLAGGEGLNRKYAAQLLSKSGNEKWTFITDRGKDLFGLEKPYYLRDARMGPDGRIWIYAMQKYSPAEERDDYVLCLDGDLWKQIPVPGMGPGDGIISLRFLGVDEPALHYIYKHRRPDEQQGLLQLRNDEWIDHPAQQMLRESDGPLLWNGRDSWLFRKSNNLLVWQQNGALLLRQKITPGKTTIEGYRISGAEPSEIHGPISILTIDEESKIWSAALSTDGNLALFLRRSPWTQSQSTYLGYQLKLDAESATDRKEIPAPDYGRVNPGVVFAPPAQPVWSPSGELMTTVQESTHRVSVIALRGGKWERVAEFDQPRDKPRIFVPRLYFSQDSTPIVVWFVAAPV